MRATDLDRRNAGYELGPGWRWLAADGRLFAPPQMETRHLFNMVVMIWNHSMPGNAATHDFIRHRFNPETHGPRELRTAVAMMLPELAKRDDLTPDQLARLRFMQAYLAKHPNLLPAPLPALPAPKE